jgi:enterochelin esterase-like enzyme
MQLLNLEEIFTEKKLLYSSFLQREVMIEFFLPKNINEPSRLNLLLINDGQNLEEMGFRLILEKLMAENLIESILCAGIYAGPERKMEYGIAASPDYLKRGAKAGLYASFVLKELLPFIHKSYFIDSFKEMGFAGFSLGGLMAMDMVWNYPDLFTKAGIFSGSFWWRSLDQDDKEYEDDKHRIMQQEIRKGHYHPGLNFFFQCGNKDETEDRNQNGIIDSIDDTIAVIDELEKKGYDRDKDIYYLEMPDGRHDIATWEKAMPLFLEWGWGKRL